MACCWSPFRGSEASFALAELRQVRRCSTLSRRSRGSGLTTSDRSSPGHKMVLILCHSLALACLKPALTGRKCTLGLSYVPSAHLASWSHCTVLETFASCSGCECEIRPLFSIVRILHVRLLQVRRTKAAAPSWDHSPTTTPLLLSRRLTSCMSI
jgi:hypothetical protein